MVSIFSDILPCDPIAEENIISIWTYETRKYRKPNQIMISKERIT